MQVFLCWSGERSKAVALTLSDWIPRVIQAVDPWMSHDTDKGARWSPEIAERLELSKVGIVCLTSENLNAPWVLYEAGAISKTKDAKVCTLLLDVKPSDVEQPLGQFQHTTRSKDDIKLLLRTINKSVETAGEKVLADSLLDKVFETAWPELSATLEQIAARPSSAESPPRSQVAMLEELLEIMSRYTHRVAISNSRLLALDERGVTFYMEGLPHDGEGALQDHAPRCRRVHAPLPVARPAQRLPPHSPLRAACQCRAPRASRPGTRTTARRSRQGRPAVSSNGAGRHDGTYLRLPALRRRDEHRRDLRSRPTHPRPAGIASCRMSTATNGINTTSALRRPLPIADGLTLRGQNRTSRQRWHHRIPPLIVAITPRRDVLRRPSGRSAPSRPPATRPIPIAT